MIMGTSLIFAWFSCKYEKNKHSWIYKKTHRSPLCPIRMYDVNGKSDNSVANRAEFELLCRWMAAVLSNSKTNNNKTQIIVSIVWYNCVLVVSKWLWNIKHVLYVQIIRKRTLFHVIIFKLKFIIQKVNMVNNF